MSEGKADRFQRLLLANLQRSERRRSLVRFARVLEGPATPLVKQPLFCGRSVDFEPTFEKLTAQTQKVRRLTSYRPTFAKTMAQTSKESSEAVVLPKVLGMSAESNFNDFRRKRFKTEPTPTAAARGTSPETAVATPLPCRPHAKPPETALLALEVPPEAEPRRSQLRLFQKVLTRKTVKQLPVCKGASHRLTVSKSRKSYWMRSIDCLLSQERIRSVQLGYYRTFRMEEIGSCDFLSYVLGKLFRDIECERMRF